MRGAIRAGFISLGLLAGLPSSTTLAATGPIDWSLRGIDGHAVTPASLSPRWLLIYFGYTSCPDLCPTALLDLVSIFRDLKDLGSRLQPVFITIDPDRDTPDVLKQYVGLFDAPILALTGTDAEIAAVAHQFDFHYVRYHDPRTRGDSFDHSSAFFLVDPDHRRVADFATPDIAADDIAAAVRDWMEQQPGQVRPRRAGAGGFSD